MSIVLEKENFNKEVMDSSKTVLIDFWAPWCSPCRMLSPIIDEISSEAHKNIVVGKVNIDEQPELAAQFKVMSIPTLLVIKNGEVVQKSVGIKSKAIILGMLL